METAASVGAFTALIEMDWAVGRREVHALAFVRLARGLLCFFFIVFF